MTIVWVSKEGHEYLNCQLTNTSKGDYTIDANRLPCTSTWSVSFWVFSTTGQALYTQPIVKLDLPMAPPEPLVLHNGQTVERRMELSTLPFYDLANREDLNLIWSAPVVLYSSPEALQHRKDAGYIRQVLVGTTYIPKRRTP
jgi:hypothetical protein